MDTSEPKIHIWLVVSTPLKHISRLGVLFPYKYKYKYIYNMEKHVPNHQPNIFSHAFWDILGHQNPSSVVSSKPHHEGPHQR